MTPSEELDIIQKKINKTIGKYVKKLFSDFVKVSPVDTGSFRESWTIKKTSGNSWRISNNTEYATILFDGRRLVADKWQGSEQWPNGGHAMLEKFNIELEKALDKVKA